MEGRTILLAMGMLLTGTLNTIATKYQDMVVVDHDKHGQVYFQHPVVQSGMMFLGEMLCLIPYVISFCAQRWAEHPTNAAGGGISERRRSAHSLRAVLAFSIPAACDACGTTLLNIGLFFTYASAFQMLRGTLVFFCGILTIIILRRRLHVHHWLGMCLIVAGAALVGLASLITPDWGPLQPDAGVPTQLLYMGRRGLKAFFSLTQSETAGTSGGTSGASRPLLGNLLVVLAQVAAATQFIVEEKFLTQYRVPALLAVGLEGFWGLLLCMVAGPFLARLHVGGGVVDRVPEAFQQIAASPALLWSTIASIISIAFFNSFGVKVTKRLSGAARAAIDACRTLFIWVAAVGLGWEPLSPPLRIVLQVLGFAVLVSGTSLYNELLRACLPTPPRDADTEDQPALDTSPTPAASYDARPRPIKDDYSLARSMRVLPQALSPHSLSSVRFSRAYGPLGHAFSEAQLGHSADEESLSTRASWLSRGGAAADEPAVFGDEGSMLESPLLGGDEGRRTPPPRR